MFPRSLLLWPTEPWNGTKQIVCLKTAQRSEAEHLLQCSTLPGVIVSTSQQGHLKPYRQGNPTDDGLAASMGAFTHQCYSRGAS